ncbi:TPA: restriction endonuclease subunit S [Vibrio cholerae]
MSSNWPLKKISDVAYFRNNKRIPLKSLDRAKRQGEFPYYGASGIVDYIDDYIFDGSYLLISEDGENLRTRKTPIAFQAHGKFWVNNHAHILEEKEEGILDYLEYYFSTLDLTPYITGAVQPKLNKANLDAIEIPIPPIDERRSINRTLNHLRDKIAVNTQTNQTLEQIAQAIFKSWFVDFDPVKAKSEALAAGGSADDAELAAMSAISAKTVDELNSLKASNPKAFNKLVQTAALFPAAMQDSELGEIPEGWEIGTLESHTSMIIDHRGKTPKKLGSDWVKDGYPAISAKNIKSKKIVRSDTIRFIDEVTYKKWMKEPLIKGDIIMTSEAPMGELYFFDGSQNFCLSQRLYGLRANSEVCSSEFLFNWLQTTKAQADMEGRASGTTALGIKQAELRKVKILTPPRELLETYSLVASNLVDMAANNNAQNTVLADMRDTLLPKLLAGEIDLTREVTA